MTILEKQNVSSHSFQFHQLFYGGSWLWKTKDETSKWFDGDIRGIFVTLEHLHTRKLRGRNSDGFVASERKTNKQQFSVNFSHSYLIFFHFFVYLNKRKTFYEERFRIYKCCFVFINIYDTYVHFCSVYCICVHKIQSQFDP